MPDAFLHRLMCIYQSHRKALVMCVETVKLLNEPNHILHHENMKQGTFTIVKNEIFSNMHTSAYSVCIQMWMYSNPWLAHFNWCKWYMWEKVCLCMHVRACKGMQYGICICMLICVHSKDCHFRLCIGHSVFTTLKWCVPSSLAYDEIEGKQYHLLT